MAADRYVQVGWWDKDHGFMHALHYSGPKSGFTPLYERQWPLEDAVARDAGNGVGDEQEPDTYRPMSTDQSDA